MLMHVGELLHMLVHSDGGSGMLMHSDSGLMEVQECWCIPIQVRVHAGELLHIGHARSCRCIPIGGWCMLVHSDGMLLDSVRGSGMLMHADAFRWHAVGFR
jgi:hypothetical protein